MGAPPRALCELHSGPHVKKIVLRLRSKKAEISKRLWPRNRKNGKRIYIRTMGYKPPMGVEKAALSLLRAQPYKARGYYHAHKFLLS